MEIKRLRYFMEVVDAGSFLRAAARLGVAQPTLSRQVSQLEQTLGTVLLTRHVRGVELTEAGIRLRAHAEEILSAVDRAVQDLNDVKSIPRGQISIGVTPTVVETLIPPLTRAFGKMYPDVSIKVAEGLSGHIQEWLLSGEVQLGLLYHAGDGDSLIAEPLISEALYLVVPPAAPLAARKECSLRDLVHEKMILPSGAHGLRRLIEDAVSRAGLTIDVAMNIDSLFVTRDYLLEGRGCSILPIAAVAREVDARRLVAVPIVDPCVSRTLYLATKTGTPLSLAARKLARAVRLQAKQMVRDGVWPGGAI